MKSIFKDRFASSPYGVRQKPVALGILFTFMLLSGCATTKARERSAPDSTLNTIIENRSTLKRLCVATVLTGDEQTKQRLGEIARLAIRRLKIVPCIENAEWQEVDCAHGNTPGEVIGKDNYDAVLWIKPRKNDYETVFDARLVETRRGKVLWTYDNPDIEQISFYQAEYWARECVEHLCIDVYDVRFYKESTPLSEYGKGLCLLGALTYVMVGSAPALVCPAYGEAFAKTIK